MHPDCFTDADILQTEPLFLLRLLGGYYECFKDPQGARKTPLVGYAGKYKVEDGVTEEGIQKQYVGDVYANFAKAERKPRVVMTWAEMMKERLAVSKPTVVMGMPMGGIVSAFAWAYVLGCDFVFPEKKVQAVATKSQRELAILAMARHELRPGDRVLIGEDVCNNFATTSEAVRLVEEAKAVVSGISCWLNRSERRDWNGIPVNELVYRPMPEYRQEDSEVSTDVAQGNVIWKPKDEWDRLMSARALAESAVN